jgi:transcriptional regulator with XRE-family HTH domain
MKAKEGKVISLNGIYNVSAERTANVVGSRIAAARKRRGWNQETFAEALKEYGIDLSKPAVAKWETGETAPNIYQFLAVYALLDMEDSLSSYMQVHTPDLNEEGLRKVADYKRDLVCSGNYRPVPKTAYVRRREMPVALMPAAAGTGNFLDDSEYYETVSFPEDQIKPGADIGIRVSGDSMEPVYHDGQVVWVKKCEELHPGEVGILVYDGKAYIKIYDEREPGEEFLEEFTDSYGAVHMQPVLVSYNSENYDPIPVNPNHTFRIFGRVLK